MSELASGSPSFEEVFSASLINFSSARRRLSLALSNRAAFTAFWISISSRMRQALPAKQQILFCLHGRSGARRLPEIPPIAP
jgi:hypothetical protein